MIRVGSLVKFTEWAPRHVRDKLGLIVKSEHNSVTVVYKVLVEEKIHTVFLIEIEEVPA